MSQSIEEHPAASASKASILVNLLTSPGEAFREIENKPAKLFPLLLVLIANALIMLWYFSMVDFDWYIDDVLTGTSLEGEQLEQARENMASMSRRTMMGFSLLGSFAGITLIYLIQSTYLSLVSALRGDGYKFTHWFSLVCWAGLPILFSVIGMAVTIMLSPNGQLSAYDLDPLTLRNLGLNTENSSLQSLFNTVSLSMVWSAILIVLAYRQWLDAGWLRSAAVVLAPYGAVIGVWAYFALT